MKNLKNILLITSVALLGLSQFSNSDYPVGGTADKITSLNDSTIQVLLTKVSQLEEEVNRTKSEIQKIRGVQEYIPSRLSLSDLESRTQELDSKIDLLSRRDDQLESSIMSIKGTSFSTLSIEALESAIDDLKRSSHSH